MHCHNIIGILSILLFMGSYALDYSLLETLESTCVPRDNCMLAQRASFESRSCECDSQCNKFQDCCIDKAKLAPIVSSKTRPLSCMAFGGQHKVGVYAIDSCPHNYKASEEVRNLCQEDDFYDPLASAPVTVVAFNTTYKNRYCAECNGASPSTLEPWKLYLHCDTIIPLRLNDSYIWQNLEYNSSLLTWGVAHNNTFHKCEVIFEKPQNLTAVRFCRANTIDTCPPQFLRITVKKYCESYSAVVYDLENAYKNPHCAICNNRTLENLTCLDASLFVRNKKLFTFALLFDVNTSVGDLEGSLFVRNKKPFTFAHLLDVNTRDGRRVGVVDKGGSCAAGEKFDPFFKKCRTLSCVLPGSTVVNGKCQKT